jgi:hypothetical protein
MVPLDKKGLRNYTVRERESHIACRYNPKKSRVATFQLFAAV